MGKTEGKHTGETKNQKLEKRKNNQHLVDTHFENNPVFPFFGVWCGLFCDIDVGSAWSHDRMIPRHCAVIFSNATVCWSSKCSKREKCTIVCVLWKEQILNQNKVQVGWPLCMHAQCFQHQSRFVSPWFVMSSSWKADGCREEALLHMVWQRIQIFLCWSGWCLVGRQGQCSSVISVYSVVPLLCTQHQLPQIIFGFQFALVQFFSGCWCNLFVCSIVYLQTAPLL